MESWDYVTSALIDYLLNGDYFDMLFYDSLFCFCNSVYRS